MDTRNVNRDTRQRTVTPISLIASVVAFLLCAWTVSLVGVFTARVVIIICSLVVAWGTGALMASLEPPVRIEKAEGKPVDIGGDRSRFDEASSSLHTQISTTMRDIAGLEILYGVHNVPELQSITDSFRNTLSSLDALMGEPNFVGIVSTDDKELVYSLIRTYIPNTWDAITKNIKYMASFSGDASDQAKKNLEEIKTQLGIISTTTGKIEGAIVNNTTSDIATETQYLRDRIAGASQQE